MHDNDGDGLREVRAVLPSTRLLEGGGFPVRRPLPTGELAQLDPFLLLDEMGPVDWAPGEAIGAPDHPHRGFETVTYLLEGSFEHRDSAGNQGVLQPGDVQWMTAGSGIIHSELPSAELKKRGGRVHGFQIWVNLPRADKWIAPRYQDIPATRIPEVRGEGFTLRIIAGRAQGASALIDTRIPITYLHFTLGPNASVRQALPAEQAALVYLFRGTLDTAGGAVLDGQLLRYDAQRGAIALQAGAEGADLLLLGGRPLGEPVARWGPFVMNTPEEIHQAIDDYRSGKLV